MRICIVTLTAHLQLICSWGMKICRKRAAFISTAWHLSEQMGIQIVMDMETNMAVKIGDKSVYIPVFWPRENQSIIKSKNHPK